MIDRHPWILLVAGTSILAAVLLGIAFGAPPVVDHVAAFLFAPRGISLAGVLGFAVLWHELVTYLERRRDRRTARRRLLERHDHGSS